MQPQLSARHVSFSYKKVLLAALNFWTSWRFLEVGVHLTWFLKIVSVRMSVCVCVCVCVCVFVCVCLPPRLLITNGMIWHDMNPIQLVKQVL